MLLLQAKKEAETFPFPVWALFAAYPGAGKVKGMLKTPEEVFLKCLGSSLQQRKPLPFGRREVLSDLARKAGKLHLSVCLTGCLRDSGEAHHQQPVT